MRISGRESLKQNCRFFFRIFTREYFDFMSDFCYIKFVLTIFRLFIDNFYLLLITFTHY